MMMLYKEAGGERADFERVKDKEPELLCYCSLMQISGDYLKMKDEFKFEQCRAELAGLTEGFYAGILHALHYKDM